MSKNFELLQRAGKDLEYRTSVGPTTYGFDATQNAVKRDTFAHPRSAEHNHDGWLRLFTVLRRHWRLSTLFAVIVMTTVAVVTFLIKPIYEPVARLEVDRPGELFSVGGGSIPQSDAEYLETQAQNLRGDKVALAVIRKLHLDENPEFVGRKKSSRDQHTAAATNLPVDVAEEIALATFREQLTVRRDTASRLILVSFASHDPQLAALVTNTLVQTFIDNNFETENDAIMKSSEWLSHQLDDIRLKMETSSKALAEFESSIGVVDVDDNKNTYSEHMSELGQQLAQAQAERIQLESLLNNVKDGNEDSLPDVRNNPVIQQLSQKLAEQRAELSQAQVVYGQNHPTVKKLQSQVDELQNQVVGQKKTILTSLRTGYAAALARERLMAAEMKGTSQQLGQMARYAALKKEVQSEVDLYNSLYGKIKEAGIAAASKSENIRVVDPARVLLNPTRPKKLKNLAVGLLAALLGGVGLALVRDHFDRRLRSPEDMMKWLGTSNVAIIPAIAGNNDYGNAAAKLLSDNLLDTGEALAFVLDRPHSPETEALHALQTSVLFTQSGTSPQVLLVVSSFSGEGKTTVALNLALALAQQGETCLVDADLRKATLSARFGLRSTQGLAEYLVESVTLDNALHVSGVKNLTVIAAGKPNTNPGQLICSPNASRLLSELRQRFRFVVVDSVPILPFADGRALSPFADALVFVGRQGVTTQEAMQRSIQLLEEIHAAPVLQFVLNDAHVTSTEYYQYGYGTYRN